MCLNGLVYPFTYRSELADFAGDSRRPLAFGGRDADAIEAELYSHLTPVKRRLWIQRTLLLLVRATVLSAGVFLLASLLRLVGLPLPDSWLTGAVAFIGLLTVVFVVRQRVSFHDAARIVDRRLGLHQVVGTAVELIQAGADSRLARLQLRRATDAVRQVDSSEAIPLSLPMRDLRALVVAVAATFLFTFLSTVSIAWPGSAPAEEEALADEPSAELAYDSSLDTPYYEEGTTGELDPELFGPLDNYMQDLEGQNLSPEEMAQRIAEIQAQLAQRAEALNRERQALADLAEALSDSSVASDAADSIRRGDYQQAAQQLSDLAKQAEQLSPRARRDLAQRLNEAARQVAPNNAELAQRMQRAAQQLASGEQQGTEQALSEMAEAVSQAGDRVNSMQDSQGSFDPDSPYDYEGSGGEFEAEDLAGMEGFDASSSDAEGMGEGFAGEGEGAGFQEGGDPSMGGIPSRAEGEGSEAQPGGAAGSGPGREQYRPPDPSSTEGRSRLLELRGRPTGDGDSTIDPTGQVPLVASTDGTVSGVGSTGPARNVIVDPLSVRSEQNFVPWDKRPIVRDYFTDSTR